MGSQKDLVKKLFATCIVITAFGIRLLIPWSIMNTWNPVYMCFSPFENSNCPRARFEVRKKKKGHSESLV